MSRPISSIFLLITILASTVGAAPAPWSTAQAQGSDGSAQFDAGIDPAQWYQDHQIEQSWTPDYLHLATGDPALLGKHGVYEWPFALDSIGWSMQSYQDYGGTPYFHHGMDMMKMDGTDVYNRSGGQVINIENYRPGWDLYWEVAILDPDGYIWQYHHIDQPTIPETLWDKYNEYQADPVNGGFIPPDTYIGDIVYWPVVSFGKRFNHIHLNILAAGGVFVNGFEFHTGLPDMAGPEIQGIGLLQNGQLYSGNTIEGDYSLYVRARDLILDNVYYLPPWEILFSVDGGPEVTTWRFDTLPGGADESAYLDDFYVVPPTCGDYDCRDYYIDLGFIPDSQFEFPSSNGQHTALVTVRDYAGNSASQSFTYTVISHTPVADSQAVSTAEDTPLGLLLTGSDPDNDPITFAVVTPPAHGSLSGAAPNLTYTPAADYYGADSFTFRVSDGLEDSDPALVSIEVTPINDAPMAIPQVVTAAEDTPLNIILTGSDAEGDLITFTVTLSPSHGSLGGIAPNLTYTPTADYHGSDSFAFIISDGLDDSPPGNIYITVTSVNDAPTANTQSVITAANRPLEIVLAGSDVDGDLLSFTLVSSPTHGTLSGAGPQLVYTPTPGYAGPDSFTFTVSDGEMDSAVAAVSINVQRLIFLPVIFR